MSSELDWDDIHRRLIAGDFDQAWDDLRQFLDGLLFRQEIGEDRDSVLTEVLHEVLYTLVKFRRSGYLERIKHLKSYCATIAIRSRKRRAQQALERAEPIGDMIAEEEDDAPGPLELITEAELRHEVQRAIDALPPLQREVFICHSKHGMNVPQICDYLREQGRPRSRDSVQSLLKRARETLRRQKPLRPDQD